MFQDTWREVRSTPNGLITCVGPRSMTSQNVGGRAKIHDFDFGRLVLLEVDGVYSTFDLLAGKITEQPYIKGCQMLAMPSRQHMFFNGDTLHCFLNGATFVTPKPFITRADVIRGIAYFGNQHGDGIYLCGDADGVTV